MIEAKVIAIAEHTIVIEFEDASKHLQRYYIPREVLPVSVKNQPVTVSDEVMRFALPYATVSLEDRLGETLPTIQVRDLEDALRRAGLWTRQDYIDNCKIVDGVVARFRRLDTSAILNAAQGV